MKKKIIGILSCKGGVGKSTLSVNLAIYLSLFKKKYIGLFDADIYGPNHPEILGIKKTYKLNYKKILKYNITSISMGYFLNQNAPILLRGPMVSNTLLYLYNKFFNNDYDVIIIDFPPGTGDTYLSLLRDINFYGMFLITTPHLRSIDDFNRSIYMLKKFDINILGVIKNMDFYICNKCKNLNYIYGNYKYFNNIIKKNNITNIYNFTLNTFISNSSNIGVPFIFFESCKDMTKIMDNISKLIL